MCETLSAGARCQIIGPSSSLVVVSALAAFAIAAGWGKVTMTSVMHAYMGVFLVFFAY